MAQLHFNKLEVKLSKGVRIGFIEMLQRLIEEGKNNAHFHPIKTICWNLKDYLSSNMAYLCEYVYNVRESPAACSCKCMHSNMGPN